MSIDPSPPPPLLGADVRSRLSWRDASSGVTSAARWRAPAAPRKPSAPSSRSRRGGAPPSRLHLTHRAEARKSRRHVSSYRLPGLVARGRRRRVIVGGLVAERAEQQLREHETASGQVLRGDDAARARGSARRPELARRARRRAGRAGARSGRAYPAREPNAHARAHVLQRRLRAGSSRSRRCSRRSIRARSPPRAATRRSRAAPRSRA